MGIVISMVCVIAVMNLTQCYLEFRSQFKRGSQENSKQRLGSQYLYVFGNLMSQGKISVKKIQVYQKGKVNSYNRGPLHIEKVTISSNCDFVDSSGFHLCPGVQFASLLLRYRASPSAINPFRLRHSGK